MAPAEGGWLTLFDQLPPWAGVLLGGSLLRVGLAAAVLLHEAGHAAVTAALGPTPWTGSFRRGLVDVLTWFSCRSLLPAQRVFIPGFSPGSDAPSLPAPAHGWHTRLAALAGPLTNGLALLSLSPLLPGGVCIDLPGAVLTTLMAGQVLALLASWSDLKAAFTGVAVRLFCGNIVVLGKVNRPSEARDHARREERMWWQIVVRGGQSGGRFILTKKGFVGWKGLNPKRAKLPRTVDRNFRLARIWARVRGIRPVEGIHQTQSHVRFATSGASTKSTAQPLSWRPARTVWVWSIADGRLAKVRRTRHHLFSFNGNIDGWAGPADDAASRTGLFGIPWTVADLQCLLAESIGTKPLGCDADGLVHTDTILGAGFQELLLTQGRWGDSFRMAFALHVAENTRELEILTDAVVREFDAAGDDVFRRWLELNDINALGCKTLVDLCDKADSHLDGLIAALENRSLSIRGLKGRLDHVKRRVLMHACVDGFFRNDLREAARAFAECARGTYAAVMQSSLYPGEVSLISFKQPIYIGVQVARDPEDDFVVVASELASVFVAGDPGPDGQSERPRHLYLMRDAELAHIQLNPGTARSTITFRDGFSRADSVITETLTPAHLAGWAKRSGSEGGRGWVALEPSNPYFQDQLPVLGVRDPVREGLERIPMAIERIQMAWRNPSSLNRRTADAFSRFIVDRVQRAESLSDGFGRPTQNAQLDLLVLGAGESLVLAGAFVEDLQRLFPLLHVLSLDSKTFAAAPESVAVGPDTIVLGVSHSGQYFNTLDDVKFLQSVHELGGCGPVFVLTGQVATLMGQAVGQSFKADAPFGERILSDGAGWRLEEPHGLTTAAVHFTFGLLLMRLAETAFQESSGGGLAISMHDLRFLWSRVGGTPSQIEEITGRTSKGFRLESMVHRELLREGRWLSWFLIEPLAVSMLSVLHLLAIFSLGTNPVAEAVKFLSAAYPDRVSPGFWPGVLVYGQATYFVLMAPVIIAVLLRLVMRRPLTDRFAGRNLFIADRGWVAGLTEAFVRRLFALGYGFCGFRDLKSGDVVASFVDQVAPSITRGDILVKGVPVDARIRATATMVSTQLRGAPSLGQSAYAVGIGQEDSAPGVFQRFVAVGGAPADDGSIGELARQIDESRTSSLYRLIGQYVMFHNLASRVRSTVNTVLPVINALGAPVFLLAFLLSLGRWRIWFRPWDLAETQSRANIFTTSVAPPIDLRAADYRPTLSERRRGLSERVDANGRAAVESSQCDRTTPHIREDRHASHQSAGRPVYRQSS